MVSVGRANYLIVFFFKKNIDNLNKKEGIASLYFFLAMNNNLLPDNFCIAYTAAECDYL